MNPALVYLREVLGIEQWLRPLSVAVDRPTAVIRIKTGWSAAERAMVEKIIGASALHGIETVSKESNASHVLVFDSEAGVSREAGVHQVIWNFGSLKALLHGDANAIQSAKREVWSLIKQFKHEAGL